MTGIGTVDLGLDPALDDPHPRRRVRRGARTRLDPFPRDRTQRWVFRLLLALPYVAVALVAHLTGAVERVVTPNRLLIERVAAIEWDRADPEWIGQLFPPVTTLLAAVIPGGSLGLAIAGSLVAGVFLQRLIEIMVQRRLPMSAVVINTIAVGGSPLFAYTATENFAAFVGLAFFGLAISDVVRFTSWRSTRAGFRAGMLLMLSALSDLSGLLYVLAAALAAPFLRHARGGERGARRANVLVIVYPTISALGAIFFLNWAFTGDIFTARGHGILDGSLERFAGIGDLVFSVTGIFLVLPVLTAWLSALAIRQPRAIIVSTLVFFATLAAFGFGLIPSSSAGNTFILMAVMSIALVPTARERGTAVLLDVLAVVLIVIAWGASVNRPVVVAWMQALASVFGGSAG